MITINIDAYSEFISQTITTGKCGNATGEAGDNGGDGGGRDGSSGTRTAGKKGTITGI